MLNSLGRGEGKKVRSGGVIYFSGLKLLYFRFLHKLYRVLLIPSDLLYVYLGACLGWALLYYTVLSQIRM